jgi:hypothetical protein
MEGVASNWTEESVGSGGLWRGHSDNGPATALEANTDDSLGYTGTGQSAPSIERRTYTLSNGQVIWDLSGDVLEWMNDTIKANEKPSMTGGMGVTDNNWRQWTDIILYGALSYDLVRPSNATWTSTQNIGQYYKGACPDTTLYTFRHGGFWNRGAGAGLFHMNLDYLASYTASNVGFRCVVRFWS